jgi:hypothetical protein
METIGLTDLQLAETQLTSWVENETRVRLIFEPEGFSIGLNEDGTLGLEEVFAGLDGEDGGLTCFETFFVLRNSTVTVFLDPRRAAASEVRREAGLDQVRLKYAHGQLSIVETREPVFVAD